MAAKLNRLAGFPVTSSLRLPVGALLNLAGALLAAAWLADRVLSSAAAREAMLASLLAGAATGIGALLLALLRRPVAGHFERFMAAAGGMMLAAAVFSLLLPALPLAAWPLALDVVLAALLGALLMHGLDRAMPHSHPGSGARAADPRKAQVLLIVAIAVHNLPEGFAVGAGFGGGAGFGWRTAASIGVQNIPEGLIVATALWTLGLSRRQAALGALLTGLIEPLGAALGIVAGGLSATALPLALGLAGGAMLFVVIHEARAVSAATDAASIASAASGQPNRQRVVLPFVLGFVGMLLVGMIGQA